MYLPLGTELRDSDPLELHPGSIAASVGDQTPGSRTARLQYDDNGPYISGLLTLAPQTYQEVSLEYDLPIHALNTSEGVIEYHLNVVVQAGTRGRSGELSVTLPEGHEIVDAPESAQIGSNEIKYSISSNSDDDITIAFRRIS